MAEFFVPVRVICETREQANEVIENRCCGEEDYGFDYEIQPLTDYMHSSVEKLIV